MRSKTTVAFLIKTRSPMGKSSFFRPPIPDGRAVRNIPANNANAPIVTWGAACGVVEA